METLKVVVGVLHEPAGTSMEFFWTMMNHVGWSNGKMQEKEGIALDTMFIPKGCDNHFQSLAKIFEELKSRSYRYFWLVHDQTIPAAYSLIQFIEEDQLAVCGGYWNRSGRKYVGAEIDYCESEVLVMKDVLEDVPHNFLCQREFLEFCDYDVTTFLSKPVLFDGKYVSDTIGKHGEYYPSSKEVDKYLNPADVDIPFKFGGFRFLTEPVNINALTVPEESLEKVRSMTPEEMRRAKKE